MKGVLQQADILEQKNLSNPNSSNNCCGTGGFPLDNSRPYSQERLLLKKQLIKILKDRRTWFKKKEKGNNIYIPPENLSLELFDFEEIEKQLIKKLSFSS